MMGYIFKPIRWLLGQIIILVDWLTRPKPMQRTLGEQKDVDLQTKNLVLYQFKQCPFCVKTRRTMRRLALDVEKRDARYDPKWNQELINDGGKYQVPCLKITTDDGSIEWMYESTVINRYLSDRFTASV